MKETCIRLQKTSNQENDYIIVEAVDNDDNYLFDVSYNAGSNRYEILFGKNLDSCLIDFDSFSSKVDEAKRLVEEDVKTLKG